MKTKTCIVCKRRRVTQQEWKTEEEKKVCLTCLSITQSVRVMCEAIATLAEEKGLVFEFNFTLTNKDVRYKN